MLRLPAIKIKLPTFLSYIKLYIDFSISIACFFLLLFSQNRFEIPNTVTKKATLISFLELITSSMASSSAQLRLMSDLKSIINEPPEVFSFLKIASFLFWNSTQFRTIWIQGCSASPLSDDNLFVWSATIFGPDETPWEGRSILILFWFLVFVFYFFCCFRVPFWLIFSVAWVRNGNFRGGFQFEIDIRG